MHELSIAGAVLNTAEAHAGQRRVTLVSLQVGRLRQVIPSSLTFYWDIVSRDTACEGSRLELTEIDVRLGCEACGQEWEPEIPAFRCPRCASAEVTVLAGQELEVEYIEVEEQEGACIAPR